MLSEEIKLLQLAAECDSEAFDALFHKYKPEVYRFAVYLSDNNNEAEELFQETWFRVVKNIRSISKVENFKAWVFTILVNIHRDELRKRKFRRLISSQSSFAAERENEVRMNSDKHKVNDESEKIELELSMSEAINKLSVKHRRVFVLKVIEGFQHNEIGEILSLPVGTVKSHLHYAIKFLQKELIEFNEVSL